MKKRVTYTLSEAVERLCPAASQKEVSPVSRKIQNWVTAGLVEPLGQKHGGRGAHRQFDRYEIWKIAVLLEIGAYKVPVTVMKLVADIFDDTREEARSKIRKNSRERRRVDKLAKLIDQAKSKDRSIYLRLYRTAEGPAAADLGTSRALRAGALSAIFVDIGAIWRQRP